MLGQLLPSDEELQAKCLELGLLMRRTSGNDVTHPPLTLRPSRMNKAVLTELMRRQTLWNEAVDRTARDYTFIAEALRETAASDVNFTGRLVDMLHEIYIKGGNFQPLMLGIFRTDYMRAVEDSMCGDDADTPETASAWKNVEINTISVSFAGLSPLVAQFHQYLSRYDAAMRPGSSANHVEIHQSDSSSVIPRALADAVALWRETLQVDGFIAATASGRATPLLPVVLVVTQENERNTGDQFKLLFELLETHGIVSIRRTHTELHGKLRLAQFSESPVPFAVIEETYIAAVVYFRSAYVPSDFPTEATWQVHASLERSNAIKCPSLPYHLLTFKKIQQMWTDVPRVLTPVAFAGDARKAATLAEHFMPQYSLNAAEATTVDPEVIIQEAIADPSKFVLKPQLEGGGNLVAGDAMRVLLRDTKPEDALYNRIRKEYILMRKILFPRKTGVVLRQGTRHHCEHNLCSELGIFGVILGSGAATPEGYNKCGGYIVRTKPADVEDGGVMMGVACLDSIATVE